MSHSCPSSPNNNTAHSESARKNDGRLDNLPAVRGGTFHTDTCCPQVAVRGAASILSIPGGILCSTPQYRPTVVPPSESISPSHHHSLFLCDITPSGSRQGPDRARLQGGTGRIEGRIAWKQVWASSRSIVSVVSHRHQAGRRERKEGFFLLAKTRTSSRIHASPGTVHVCPN